MRAPLTAIALALLACSPRERELRGLYAEGFEMRDFTPCQEPRTDWWIEDAALSRRYRAVAHRDYEPVFVRLRGMPSAAAPHRHLTDSTPRFEVHEIRELRARRSGECVTLLDSLPGVGEASGRVAP
jgi:hypothetical protein